MASRVDSAPGADLALGSTTSEVVDLDGDTKDHRARSQDVATHIVDSSMFDEDAEQVGHERQAGDHRPDGHGAEAQAGPKQRQGLVAAGAS